MSARRSFMGSRSFVGSSSSMGSCVSIQNNTPDSSKSQICTRLHAQARTHAHTHARAHAHTHMHTHTHIKEMACAHAQCDTLRPLRLPTLLVGDPRLGGISSTISAYESLLLRGYDTDVILFMDQPPPPPCPRTPTHAAVPPAQAVSPALAADPCAPTGVNAAAVHEHLRLQFHSMGRPGPRVMSIPACPPPPPLVPTPASQSGVAGAGDQEVAPHADALGSGLDASLVAWLQVRTFPLAPLSSALARGHLGGARAGAT